MIYLIVYLQFLVHVGMMCKKWSKSENEAVVRKFIWWSVGERSDRSASAILHQDMEHWTWPSGHIDIWLSKKLTKTWHFFPKKLPKIFIFFKKIANFFSKVLSFGQFFDSQIAIFLRVRFTYQTKHLVNWEISIKSKATKFPSGISQ